MNAVMAASVSDHMWDLEDVAEMVEGRKAGKLVRGGGVKGNV